MYKGMKSKGGAAGDERMSPTVCPRRMVEAGVAGMRGAGGGKEKVCLNQQPFFSYFGGTRGLVRNWGSGGITNVPGLCMPQT